MKKSLLMMVLGMMVCLGAQAEKKVYVAYNDDDKSLTYYCDDQMASRDGLQYTPSSYNHINGTFASKVLSIVIDQSMADTMLTSWAYLFASLNSNCQLIHAEEITGLEYLKADNVTSMSWMFFGCQQLKELDLSSWSTPKLTTMDHMFSNCMKLERLDISSFNTSKLTSLRETFLECKKLKAINLLNTDFTKVTDMTRLFLEDEELMTIWCEADWSGYTIGTDDDADMFTTCNNLAGSQGTHYDMEHVEREYAHVDGGSENPGYFSSPDVLYAHATSVKNILEGFLPADPIEGQLFIIEQSKAEVDAFKWDFNATLYANLDSFATKFSAEWAQSVKLRVDKEPIEVALDSLIGELYNLYVFAGLYMNDEQRQFIKDHVNAADAVLINPNSTLEELTTAKETAATQLLTDAGVVLLIAQQQACADLDALLEPGDSEACKTIIADAKNVVLNIAWDSTKSVEENRAIITKTISDNYQLAMTNLEAQREAERAGIENVRGANEQAGKFIKNGQLFIIRDGKVYNALGAQIAD